MARKILLADDSVTAQNMGRKILADAGYDVVTVNNGSAALKRITEIKPDLIVLDVYMPGYSGLEVCQRLKDTAETAHIPVLLTVGKLEPFKPEEARRVRADGHIVKPFEASELLTAITRLEDRMVPQSEARFSTSVSGLERFGGEERGRKAESGGETDTGWKSRLRFPSKKKKEEPEPEPEEVAEAATFRDFRKKKGKPGNGPSFTVKEPAPPGQEPGLVPDIPRDITPDELDALSAVAAKLDGLVPEAEDIAPLAAKTGPTAAAEVAAVQTAAAKMEAAKAQAVQPETARPETTKPELELPAPAAVVAAAAGVGFPAPAVEGKSVESKTIESKNEVEIPVEQLEPASDAAPIVADSTPEKHKVETDRPSNSEIQPPDLECPEASPVTVAVNPASLAQGPAPVEQDAVPEKKDQRIEGKPPEAVAKVVTSEVSTPAETAVAQDQESKVEESAKVPESKTQELAAEAFKAEELKAAELKAKESETEKIAQLAPNAANKPAEAEEPVPTDEELAEALRLLTPATVYTDIAALPSHGTLVAAGQLLAEEVARDAAAGPRWVAEPVALSPEEAAISLEAEMFRTFATTYTATSTATPAPIAARGSTRITGVSAITAAVENRLAEAGMVADARAVAEQQAERDVESRLMGTSAVAAPGETTKTASNAVSPVVEAIVSEISARATIPPDESVAEKPEVVQKGSSAKVAEEAPPEEVATATFADAVGRGNENEDTPAAQPSAELVSAVTAMAAPVTSEENRVEEENHDSSSDSGSEESMGKDGKSGTWHQIRTAPAGAAANTNLVEAAKQAEASAEESPKAMAAAAAEGSVSTSTTDASTIASIVDSVMADLRPKIVEEIAKKLSGK
ncbi:MAG TPA: response regulator [Terriglobales bacterium]|nr:response regulator [Terriglobales bacterium]